MPVYGNMNACFVIFVILIIVAVVIVKAVNKPSAVYQRECRGCGQTHPPHAEYCRRCGRKL